VTINPEDGSVMIAPETNWSGNEVLTFFASDDIFEVSDDLEVTVEPVNDPPGPASIISPQDGETIPYRGSISLEGECTDPDLDYGDELLFRWSSNISGLLGYGSVIDDVILPSGHHEIMLIVSDSSGGSSSVSIEVRVQQGSSGDHGISIAPVKDVVATPGIMLVIEVVLQNTGSLPDRFGLELNAGVVEGPISLLAPWEVDVPAGSSQPVEIYIDIREDALPGDHEVELIVSSLEARALGFDVSGMVMFTITVLDTTDGFDPGTGAEDREGDQGSYPGQWFTILAVVLVGIIILVTSPWWYLGLLFLTAPLMVRLRSSEEESKWRDRIFYTIASKPGINFTGIKGWLGVSNGSLVYNLEILQKEGHIVSKRDGIFKKFYPVRNELDRKQPDFLTMIEKIALIVRDNPGAAQSEIAYLMEDSWHRIHYQVNKMVEEGILQLKPGADGHPRIYFAEGEKAEDIKKNILGKVIKPSKNKAGNPSSGMVESETQV
jgi:predicted transcriptional regulator